MMPLVYFMKLPSYVDRRRCLLLEKNLHSLCITIYEHSNTFTKVHVIAMVLSLYKLYKFFSWHCIQSQWSSGYATGKEI